MTAERMPAAPIFCLITGGTLTDENFTSESESILEIIRAAEQAGIAFVQIREKKLSAKHLFQLTSVSVGIAKNFVIKVLVNDRADIAAAAEADGVQLTEVSLPVDVIRAAFPDLLIGASTHSVSSIIAAADNGADFALFGPIFPTPGKEKAQGLDALATACRSVPAFRVLAIGGVDETNYHRVLMAGAAGFAAIRFLNNKANLKMIGTGLIKNGK